MFKSVTQHSYFEKKNPTSRWVDFQNNPSIGWVHPKSTHVCPLAWGNNKIKKKLKPFLPWAPSPRVPLLKSFWN
jgi:hypothetical protein